MSSPRIFTRIIAFALSVMASHLSAQESEWNGDWITDDGEMSFFVESGELTGSFGLEGDVSGSVDGNTAEIEYTSAKTKRQQAVNKKAKIALGDEGVTFSSQGKGKKLRGWKLLDKIDEHAAPADFSGHWLSNWGNMVLQQKGNKVTGIFGSQGLATLEGTVRGRRMNFKFKRYHFTGEGFIEQNADGSRIYGTTIKTENPSKWIGVKPSQYQHHVAPKAGQIVKGYADNGMLYHLRMPDNWKDGDPVDVIVLFHGSNFTTLGMVHITAKNWPDIGKKYAILGIQGDRWADWSNEEDLRHNYHYVNWMGRSTYQGYPYTDRESPSLVMEVIEELGNEHSFERTFVGGHSQGGYLTYTISMHFPDQVDGTFPIAGGMMIQCEPDVFDDADLQRAQRTTPMVILHGKSDRVVNYSMSEYAYNRLLGHGFNNVLLLNPALGHPYDFLPVDEAIAYLDALTTDDAQVLLDYTEMRAAQKDWRTVGLALQRAEEIGEEKKFESIKMSFESEAAKHADRHLKEMKKGVYGKWLDRFLRWHEDFALADAAAEVNEQWEALAAEHSRSAKELSKEASQAFRSGKQADGWELRKKIVLENFASPQYRTLKNGVEKKFGKLYKLVNRRQ